MNDQASWQQFVKENSGKAPFDMMCEERIFGTEITVSAWQPDPSCPIQALGLTALVPNVKSTQAQDDFFYDYRVKYLDDQAMAHVVSPTSDIIPEDVQRLARKWAVKIHQALGCRTLSRSDFIVARDREGQDALFYLETNTQPGMTASSLSPEHAAAAGMSFDAFVKEIIFAAKRWYDIDAATPRGNYATRA